MSTLKMAIIGCGPMGQSLAKGCLALKDNLTLCAAADVNSELLGTFTTDFGATGYTDYGEMLDKAGIDAVIIASPPFLHREMTEAAAERGIHIFCEKPMAPTVTDCDAMIQYCKAKGVSLMIGQVARYHAVHSKVKELVSAGTFGAPRSMAMRRLGSWYSGVWGKSWRNRRDMSGGNLMELNAHEIDFMRWVCGDVEAVFAVGNHHPDSVADFPDPVMLSLYFRNGAVGTLHASCTSALAEYGGRVDCEKGSLSFPAIWGEGAGITMKGPEDESFIAAADIKVETPVTHELRDFADALVNQSEPPIPGAVGRGAVEVAEAAYRSVSEKRLITLPLA